MFDKRETRVVWRHSWKMYLCAFFLLFPLFRRRFSEILARTDVFQGKNNGFQLDQWFFIAKPRFFNEQETSLSFYFRLFIFFTKNDILETGSRCRHFFVAFKNVAKISSMFCSASHSYFPFFLEGFFFETFIWLKNVVVDSELGFLEFHRAPCTRGLFFKSRNSVFDPLWKEKGQNVLTDVRAHETGVWREKKWVACLSRKFTRVGTRKVT